MHRRRSRIVLPIIFITSVTSSKRNNGEKKKNRDVREILIQIDCRIKYSTRIVRI